MMVRKNIKGEDAKKVLEEMKGPDVPSIDNALLNSATKAEESGNFKNAAQFYAQLVDKNPTNQQYLFSLAETLRQTGGYEKAIEAYGKITDADKKAPALEGTGLCYMALGEYDKAGDSLAKVMEQDAARWRTVNAIGILFTIRGLYPEARQYFTEARSIAPDNVAVHNNMALMEALDKNYTEAERLLLEAGGFPAIRKEERMQLDMNLALIYAIQGDLKRAEAISKPHLTEAQLYNNMGYYAHLADDDQLAQSYLNMALTKSPTYYGKAWENLDSLNQLIRNAPGKSKQQPALGNQPVLQAPSAKP